MPEAKDMTVYEMGSWLSQNMKHFANLEQGLKELESRKDSLPPNVNPRVLLQFMRGAVNEVKRVTSLNQSLIAALKDASPKPTMTEMDGKKDE